MKRKILLLLGLLLLVAVGVALYFFTPETKPEILRPSTGTNGHSITNGNLATATNAANAIDLDEARKQRAAASVNSLNAPLDFWGVVVDQFGSPISDAEVIMTSVEWQLLGLAAQARHQTNRLVTDAQGKFSFSGKVGASITIRDIRKDGYQFDRLRRMSFGYTNSEQYKGDSKKPETFQLWKRQGAERTIVHSRNQRIPYDGTPLLINLASGAVGLNSVSNPDVRISLLREPKNITWGTTNQYDWQATVEAINGGILTSRDSFMYLAPAEGYAAKVTVGYLRDSPDWKKDEVFRFYVRTAGGNYARMELHFRTGSDRENTGFSFSSCLNPSGSRNLEYDETKQ